MGDAQRCGRIAIATLVGLAACGRDVEVIWAASEGASGGGSGSGEGSDTAAAYDGLCETADEVSSLPPGFWCEAPASALRPAAPCDGQARNFERGNDCDPEQGITQEHYNSFAFGDARQIIWGNSAVVDPLRERVIFWGGKSGTTEWAGNEIYRFDLGAMSWARETDPPFLTDADLTQAQEDTGYYTDGTPRARKGHNTLVYIDSIASMCALGAVDLFRRGNSLPNTDCYAFDEQRWIRYDDFPGVGGFNAVALSDADQGTALLLDVRAGDLYEFDPTLPGGAQWVLRATGGRMNTAVNAVYEASAQRIVTVGNSDTGEVEVFDRNGPDAFTPRLVSTTGDTSAVAEKWPSLAPHPASGQVLAWTGGSEVYALDVDAATWVRLDPAAGNQIEPPRHPVIADPLSRFRYVAWLDAYVVINDIDRNVAFYRSADPR